MIDATRQELLRQIEHISDLAPDFRLGQLIANLSFIAAGPWDQTLWDVEDDQLLAAAQKFLTDLSRRETSVS